MSAAARMRSALPQQQQQRSAAMTDRRTEHLRARAHITSRDHRSTRSTAPPLCTLYKQNGRIERTMASGEESTFLESFVEQITNLPNEVRRNLDLVKDLDKSCSQIVGQLREAEEAFVQRAEQTILDLPLAARKRKRDASSAAEKIDDDDSKDDEDVVVPTTEELRGRIMNPAEMEMIARLRREAIQQAEEKVVVAEQTYSMVDEVVKRLDSDLSKFEV